MLLGALVAWFLPRVQYGKDNRNEKLEYLGRGPPSRPPPAADAEQVQQEGQRQQQDSLAPRNVLPGEMQQQQNQRQQPWPVSELQSSREQDGEQPERSDEESPHCR